MTPPLHLCTSNRRGSSALEAGGYQVIESKAGVPKEQIELHQAVAENVCKLSNNVSQGEGRMFLARACLVRLPERRLALWDCRPCVSSPRISRTFGHCHCPALERIDLAVGRRKVASPGRRWAVPTAAHVWDPHSAQLKAKDAKTFSSAELFWNVFKLLDMYDFKLPIRRSIHDLFQESRVADGFFQIWDELK